MKMKWNIVNYAQGTHSLLVGSLKGASLNGLELRGSRPLLNSARVLLDTTLKDLALALLGHWASFRKAIPLFAYAGVSINPTLVGLAFLKLSPDINGTSFSSFLPTCTITLALNL